MLVKDIMSSSVVTVSPDETIENICFLMKSEDVGIVPVCDKQNHVLGIITDRDVVLKMAESIDKPKSITAKEFMSPNPVTISSGEDIHKAALQFSMHKIRRLPVLDGDRLVGMLCLKDMAKKKVLMVEIGHIIYNICN